MNLSKHEEIAPAIFLYKNAFENYEEVIKKATDEGKYDWDLAPVVMGGNTEVDKKNRVTQRIDIAPVYRNNAFWFEVAQRLWQYGNDYAVKNEIYFSDMEPPQMLLYPKGEGFYKAHQDSGLDTPRIFSLVLYLNDVKDGGETIFPRFNISVKPIAGSLIIFPGDYPYIHEASVPKSSEKIAIVTWFKP